MSIFEKIRLFALGNLHQMLNAAIDRNSIADLLFTGAVSPWLQRWHPSVRTR